MVQTVVGLFERFEDAQRVVQELNKAGFDKEKISLIARDEKGEYTRRLEGGAPPDVSESAATGVGIGAILGGLGGLLVGLGALAIPGIGAVIAAGPVAAAIAGATIGAVSGGLLGALVDLGIPEEHANAYVRGIEKGGTLVVVHTENDRAEDAMMILNRFNPVDIEAPMSRDEAIDDYDRMSHDLSSAIPVTGEPYNHSDAMNVEMDMDDDQMHPQTMGNEPVMGHDPIPVTGQEVDIPADVRPTSSVSDWNSLDRDFRAHYQSSHANSGYAYAYYMPAYRYGYGLALDSRFRAYDWDRIEPQARIDWVRRGGQGHWDEIKDAVRYAWEHVKR